MDDNNVNSQANDNMIWVSSFEDPMSFVTDFNRMQDDPSVEVIFVYIHSYGGSVLGLSAMRDCIKLSGKPVATIAMGMSMSAGAALLASGTKGMRFIAPSAEIMIHEVSGGAFGTNTEVQNTAAWLHRINDKFLTWMSDDMGISKKALRNMMDLKNNADIYLSAEQAVEHGIADAVGLPKIVEDKITRLVLNKKGSAHVHSGEPKPAQKKRKKTKSSK